MEQLYVCRPIPANIGIGYGSVHDVAVLLTKQGRAAAVLVHPDYWNQLAALLEELEDIAVAEQRLAEVQEDEDVIVSLVDGKTA